MPELRRALSCLALLLLAGAPRVTAEDFVLRVHRAEPVGHRSRVTGTFHSVLTRSSTANGKESQETKEELYRFDVTSQILRVGTRENVLEAMLTIHQLTREADGASTPLLAGEIVLARLDKNEKILEVRGQKLPNDVRDALLTAVSLRADDDPNDDDLLGTGKSRSLGETWPVDAEVFTRLLRKKGNELTFTPKDVVGTVKLAGKKPVGDLPGLELQTVIEIKNPTLSLDLPPGLTASVPALKVNMSMLLPVDPTSLALVSSYQMETTVLMNGTVQGMPVTGKMQMRQEGSAQSVPVGNPAKAEEKKPG